MRELPELLCILPERAGGRQVRVSRVLCGRLATRTPMWVSTRNGDSLFQEYETLNFERPGYERYEKIIAEMRQLSARLHDNTKFDRLTKCGAANLFQIVANAELVSKHQLPCAWGLLVRTGDALELKIKPLWHDVSDDERLMFFQRVSMAATRCVNREHGVAFENFPFSSYGISPTG